MSFAAPLWLLSLLAIPLLLVLQWRWRERGRRYAVRFTAVASLAQAVAESGGRWRRHLPLATLLAALALVMIALARPQMSHRIPRGDASFMLVLDHSGSMASDDVSPSRIQAAISAGNTFINELPSNDKVGLVAFGNAPDAVQQPVADHAATRALLDAQQANGGTATGPALALALQLLDGTKKHHAPAAIILLSDGAANVGTDPVTVAAEAKQDKIPIYTVALGTPYGVLEGPFGETQPVPPDPQLMAEIAQESGGRAFDAQTAEKLSSIYKTLGSRLGSVKRERDLTVWAVLLAALLLLLAAAGSVRTRFSLA